MTEPCRPSGPHQCSNDEQDEGVTFLDISDNP